MKSLALFPYHAFASPRRYVAIALFCQLMLSAQQTQPPSVRPALAPDNDEVVVMSEFSVSSTKDKNYVASESITGTRVAAKIRDLPFVVNAVTSEFLLDFAAFDMDAQLGWVANISPTDINGSLILRGFASTPYVDGFRRLGPLDLVDTDRIEIIKGPAASIYGQTLPGGVVNYTSKRPETKRRQRISFAVGNESQFRADLSSTGPVGTSTKFYYLVNLATQRRHYEQDWASQKRHTISAQLMYKPDAKTSLYMKVSGQKSRNNDRQSIPWLKTSTAGFYTDNGGKLGLNADGTPLKYTYPTLSYDAATGAYATATATANLPLKEVVVKYNAAPDDLKKYYDYLENPAAWSAPLALSTALSTTNS
ncbi:TonB-dependent receptor plug domain-containing protein [Termitidicoccus mucosus]|uniref:TonB-dependent receptor plug domain-containing protein n=1 Tax=Termitidicoccus mucosus TaxID=1184151 RepID=A0A178IHW9_9BACT|nr:hypothetical protein AW736_16015 [Opitutaceae bacterium TSB47]